MAPKVKNVTLTVCCNLPGALPEDLHKDSPLEDWRIRFISCRDKANPDTENYKLYDICQKVFSLVRRVEGSFVSFCPYVDGSKGWCCDFTFAFRDIYDATWFFSSLRRLSETSSKK